MGYMRHRFDKWLSLLRFLFLPFLSVLQFETGFGRPQRIIKAGHQMIFPSFLSLSQLIRNKVFDFLLLPSFSFPNFLPQWFSLINWKRSWRPLPIWKEIFGYFQKSEKKPPVSHMHPIRGDKFTAPFPSSDRKIIDFFFKKKRGNGYRVSSPTIPKFEPGIRNAHVLL